MEIKRVSIDELKPHPKNPRTHPDSAIEKLERSIKEFGWTNPILVSADGYVLAGHARLKAAKIAGIKEVPVIYLPLEGAKAEAYMIADNRLQEETEWNDNILKRYNKGFRGCRGQVLQRDNTVERHRLINDASRRHFRKGAENRASAPKCIGVL
jgi:hypothetical protein